jgi:hypothetical protein
MGTERYNKQQKQTPSPEKPPALTWATGSIAWEMSFGNHTGTLSMVANHHPSTEAEAVLS